MKCTTKHTVKFKPESETPCNGAMANHHNINDSVKVLDLPLYDTHLLSKNSSTPYQRGTPHKLQPKTVYEYMYRERYTISDPTSRPRNLVLNKT